VDEKYAEIGERALNIARRSGVDAEVFILKDSELSIEVVDGQVETLKQAEEIGLGLRVIKQGRLGFAYTTEMSEAAVKQVVENAITISRYTDTDEYNTLPTGKQVYPDLSIYDQSIVATSLEEKINMARRVEEVVRATDKRIHTIERSGYEDNEYAVLIMNTSGVYAKSQGNSCGLYVFAVARDEEEAQNGFSMMLKKQIKDLQPEFVGKEAAYNAVRGLNARSIKSERMPCIMEPYIVTKFLSLISGMVNAEAVLKGKSLLADKQGQQVASQAVSIIDDATYEEGIASFPFDGEGVPSRRNVIIENGQLLSFIYDSYTANRVGVKSTGNSQRGSFRSLPFIGTTNFFLKPGVITPDQLIKEVSRGFYITEVMGMHTANPISGDFSVGAAGIIIEKGELTYPVRGVTIAGNLVELLHQIDTIAGNLRFFGGKGAPTIRLNALSIGGE